MLQSYVSPTVITNWIHGCFWAIQTVSCRVPGTPGGPPQCVWFVQDMDPGFSVKRREAVWRMSWLIGLLCHPSLMGFAFIMIILLRIINHYCFVDSSFWKWERGSFDWHFKRTVSKAKAGMSSGLKAPVISSFIYSNLNHIPSLKLTWVQKMDGWKMKFPFGKAYFQVLC